MIANVCWIVAAPGALVEQCSRVLRTQGWRVEHASSARDFFSRAPLTKPGVALIDLCLAWPKPAEAVVRLRAEAPGWRVALLAVPEDAYGSKMSCALESGADEVLVAGIPARDFSSRLAVLARVRSPETLALPDGAIRLDREQRLAWAGRSRPRRLDLTRTEFDILALLLEARGRPVPRQRLIDGVWGGGEVNAETVDRHIGALRRKLKGFSSRVRTQHGFGYAAE